MGYSQSKMMDLLQKKADTGVTLQAISSKLEKTTDLKFYNLQRLKILNKRIPVMIGGAPSFAKFGGLLLKNLKKMFQLF